MNNSNNQDIESQKLYDEYSIAVSVVTKVMREGLSKTDMRIFHKILVDLRFEESNDFPINQTELASSLLMQQPNMARSLKKLVAAQMLEKLENGNYRLLITKPYQF